MKCPDESQIAAYLSGESDPQLARHLDECARCRQLVAQGSEPAEEEAPDYSPAPWRYAVKGEYARGGQARILLATDQSVGREVVIKELDQKDQPAGAATRFLREARVCGQLQHPGVVPVYEIGRNEDGHLYYSMQLVRGQTLAMALGSCTSLGERLGLLDHYLELCNTVAYAHSQGVIHRDLKPHNVMVGEFGETIVLDWGLAKLGSAQANETPEVSSVPKAGDSSGLHTVAG